MGGLAFILATLLVAAIFFIVKGLRGESQNYLPLAMTLAFAVANGAIGFADDYCKLIKKQNEGLTETQKLFLQLVIAGAYVCVMGYTGNLPTLWKIPFTDVALELGWFCYPISIILLAGVINGANFTDGIDGLASSVTGVIGVFFAVIAFTLCDEGTSVLAGILIGATVGFLIYNFHPAKVFMGDTGSLFLGALVMGGSFAMRAPLIGLIVSAVFIIEMLSSFLQSGFFKITRILTGQGKRILKMAPLHHHFEKCGWAERKIVFAFGIVELLFCVIAWLCL